MGRRASREIAMKLLYQMEIQKDDREDQLQLAFEENVLTDSDRQYISDVIEGVTKTKDDLDSVIEKYSKGWKVNRLSKVDLSILRLSVYEINFRDDIPFNVSVNEAVELAKKYSSEDAGAFINGILGKVTIMKESPLDNESLADSSSPTESLYPTDNSSPSEMVEKETIDIDR